MLGGASDRSVRREALVVWGWLVPLVVAVGLFWSAWAGTHGQSATLDGRRVTNMSAGATEAGQDALARGASADAANDPLACYFSDPGPAYLSCGPVIIDGSLDKGWDNFIVSSHPDGSGVKVTPVDATVMVGPLPVGTPLVSGSGVLSTVGADQGAHGQLYSTAAWKAALVALAVAGLWGLSSLFSVRSRRTRKRALVAAAAQGARTVAVRQSWESLGLLAVAAPIRPPQPVLRESPPTAQFDVWPVDTETGEILDATAHIDGAPGVTGSARGIVSPAARSLSEVEQLAMPIAETDSDDGSEMVWPGPAVLVLGSPLMVGAVVEPDRKVVVELAAYLACHRPGLRSAEQVQAAVWPLSGGKGDASLDTVRQQLSRLRRCVGEENFPDAAKAGGYGLGDGVGCDWVRFQALAEAARRSEGVRSAVFRRQALALVRGAPFAGVGRGSYGWAWEELIVAQMEAAITDVAHRLSVEFLAAGEARLADWAAGRGLLAVPTDETLLGDRMAAAVELGGRSGLDRAWRDAKAVLGEQAETGPLAEVYANLAAR